MKLKWTKDAILKSARTCKTPVDWMNNYRSAYNAARRNDWIVEIYNAVWKRNSLTGRKWTEDEIIKRAKLYKTSKEWKINDPKSYSAAVRFNLLPISTQHMHKKSEISKALRDGGGISTRICNICGKELSITIFAKRASSFGGYSITCKQCEYHRALVRKYKISLEEYKNLIDRQNNACKICGISGDIQKLCVDHCHSSLKVRGLLCGFCNRGLGSFFDNLEFLTKAIEYLKANK